MLTKKDRARLIESLELALTLYVEKDADRKHFARIVGEGLEVPYLQHFIDACTPEQRSMKL